MTDEELQRRIAALWGRVPAAHLDRLRQSPLPLTLNDWLWRGPKYEAVLGRRGYLDHLIALIERAEPADLEAAYFKLGSPPQEHAWLFVDQDAPSGTLRRGPGGAHAAVLWCDGDRSAGWELWLDGARLEFPADVPHGVCDEAWDAWLDERFYAVRIAGPDDHPAQQTHIGSWFGHIMGLAIVDAERRRIHVVQPRPHERWTAPRLVAVGEDWLIYRDDAAATPERSLQRRDFTALAEPFVDRVHAPPARPEPPDPASIAEHWGDGPVLRHREALHDAPDALVVHDWLARRDDYELVLGTAGYRRALTRLLDGIAPERRAAVGLPEHLEA